MTRAHARVSNKTTSEKPSKPRRDFPLYADGNGQWTKVVNKVRYRFGSWREDPTGERAEKEWDARKEAIRNGTDNLRVDAEPVAGGMTLGELVKRFLKNKHDKATSRKRSLRTYGDYATVLTGFAEAVGVNAIIDTLNEGHFSSYLNSRVTKKGKPLAPNSLNREINYIKSCLNWKAGKWYKAPDYGDDFKADTSDESKRQYRQRTGTPDHSKRILTGDEIDKLTGGKVQPLMRAAVLLGVNCGLGPADIGRMRWRDLDFENGMLDYPRWKTGVPRRSYLWQKTRRALERLKTLHHNKLAIAKDGPDALVFVSRRGLPMYRETELLDDEGRSIGVRHDCPLTQNFKKIAKRKGMHDVSFYRLRHTFNTLAKKRSSDTDARYLAMGHKDHSINSRYDHSEISNTRLKRLALKVKRGLWPKPAKAEAKPVAEAV